MNSIISCYVHYLVLLLLLTSVINACHVDEEKRLQDGLRFFLSNDAPMSKALNTISGVAEDAQLLLDHIRNVENAVYSARQTERLNFENNRRISFETCNYRDALFGKSALKKFKAWGWEPADTSCVTERIIENETEIRNLNMTRTDGSKYTIEDVFMAISNYLKVLREKGDLFAEFAGLSHNYTRTLPKVSPEIIFSTGERCFMEANAAVRFDNIWYLRSRFALEVQNHLPEGIRQVIREFPTVINGRFSSPIPMCMQVKNDTDERNFGTTELRFAKRFRRGRNNRNLAMFDPVDLYENPSLVTALDMFEKFTQLANDALAPSNIAILVLPLFLNLVPIALISNVNTSFMLFYTLLTDILTVIPLGIKGAELISIGTSVHRSVAVRISSSIALPRSKAAAADMWVSECYASGRVRNWGVLFLVLSIVFMNFGIVLEVLAQVHMKRKRARMFRELLEAMLFVFENDSNYSDCQSGRKSQETLLSSSDSEEEEDLFRFPEAFGSHDTCTDSHRQT